MAVEFVSLCEKMEESEKKTEKLIHEITAKEQLNINLLGQSLKRKKQVNHIEEQKIKKEIKTEIKIEPIDGEIEKQALDVSNITGFDHTEEQIIKKGNQN